MRDFPYKFFTKYIIRTPLYPLTDLLEFLEQIETNEIIFKEKFKDKTIKEAIFLASPNLYSILSKWQSNDLNDYKKIDRLKKSLVKYFTRMSSRCTPFGLYAGYTIGSFSEKTDIKIDEIKNHTRHTKLDMYYLVSLTSNLVKSDKIKNSIKFISNSTIYILNDEIRYIEYKYFGLKRFHEIVSVEKTEILMYTLKIAKKGCLITEIAEKLTLKFSEFSKEEINYYINELIENQLLLSELEPFILGSDYLTKIKNKLNKIKSIDEITTIIDKISIKLLQLDLKFENKTTEYEEIYKHLAELKTPFDKKYLFQTDLKISTKNNTIDQKQIKEIKEGIIILNNLSSINENLHLKNFKTQFIQRFGESEVLLSSALDSDTGINYRETSYHNILPDDSFINNIILQKKRLHNEIRLNKVDIFINDKIVEAYRKNEYIIKLDNEDLPEYNHSWDDLPNTISFITEFYSIQGKNKIFLNAGGGSTAANLFGRFSIADKELETYCKEIIEIDKNFNNGAIMAEIVHLSEARVGNVTARASFYDHDIPYLANSDKGFKYQIPISDLAISINNSGLITLRSISNNKKVIPRLINAHNYSFNTTPIYNFLCDLQLDNKRMGIKLDLSNIIKLYKFIPRIEYKQIIFKKATWNFLKKDFIGIYDEANEKKLKEKINIFRKEWKIPRYINIIEGDNELFIDIENRLSFSIMIDILVKNDRIIFEEFLFCENNQIVAKDNKSFTNQIIISIKKNKHVQ